MNGLNRWFCPLLCGALWAQGALAQSGTGLLLPPPSVTATAPGLLGGYAAGTWHTVQRSGNWELQIDTASLIVQDGMLIYRVRDTAPASAAEGPGWAAVRCTTRERADVYNPRVMRTPFDAREVRAASQQWQPVAAGSAAAAELEHLCRNAVAPPNWTTEERDALIAAWDHSAGNEAYVLRLAHFSDADAARRASVLKWNDAKRIGAQELRTLRAGAGLVDVPVALRVAVVNLYEAGERSPVVAWRDGAGNAQWSLLELVSRGKVQPPRDAPDFDRQAQRWVAEGLLPPPAELLADAAHRARAAHWRVRSVADLAAVAPELSPSVRFGNLGTPLLRALLRDDLDMARALLARGADANACGVVGCALHLAFKKDNPARTAAWLELLLGAGARPDQFDAAFMGAQSTAMQPAAFYGARAVLERLLKAGADPNGRPGVKVTPLEGALAGGRREVAEWLIQQGASVLPHFDRSAGFIGHGNAWLASSEHPPLRAWITQAMFDAAHRDPRWAYDVHIEQDGKRWPLADGASLTLRAAPFKFVARLAHENAGGLTVATSFAPAFAAEVKAGERRNGAVRTMMSSALAPVPEPGSYELLAYEAMPAMARDSDVWGGHMVLTTDANLRADFHEQRRERGEYVREVRAIAPMPEKGAPPPALPLAALKGRELTVVLGTALVLDPMEWAPLVNLRTVTLRFQ